MTERPTTSLAKQLIVIILICMLLPALAVGWLGYSEAYDSIKAEKIRNVGRVADVRHEQLVTIFQRSNARAKAFLSDISARCTDGANGVREVCAKEALQIFFKSERSLGAALRLSGAGSDLTVGTAFASLDDWKPLQSGQLARVSAPGTGRERSYDVIAEDSAHGMRLAVTFSVDMIQGIFVSSSDLGQSGETFLADSDGFFITRGRYPSVQGHSHPISAHPMQACLAMEEREVLDQDYRDVAIIHGFRFVPEIGGGCIMAHVDQAEAFAPLRAMQWRMASLTLLFIAVAGGVSVAIGRNIAKPITRLTLATREIIGGNYQTRAKVTGNTEIAVLTRAFNQMAAAIAQNEARVRAIIDGTLDAFVGVTLKGEVVAFNRGAETLFGLPASTMIGCTVAGSALPESVCQHFAEALHRAGAGEAVSRENVEIEGIRADGRPLVAEAHLFTAGADDETLVIACLRDIAKRRQAEIKSQRLSRILRMMTEGGQALVRATDESELYRTMCNVIVEFGGYRMAWVGLADHDDEKSVRPVAQAGHEAGYLAIAQICWADVPRGRGPTGTAIRSGAPRFNNNFTANPLMSPWREAALERGYFSSISLPLRDKDDIIGALTIYANEPETFGPEDVGLLCELAEDVSYGITALRTRRKHEEMERALRHAQKMEALGHLTGGVAHDFNNLLQVILANLDLSMNCAGREAAIAGYLQNAITGAEQGAKLTSQLLAFARRQPLRPEPVQLERLVGDMADLLRRSLGNLIAIEVVAAGGLWTAMVDSNQLQTALLNMAINARDSMPDGGKMTIELSNSALDKSYAAINREVTPGQYVLLAVTDTGIGMPPKILEQAFEPFFTTKPEGFGTGLGLAMVYGFVKQSGGHIKIYSEVGHGTTVRLYLPRTRRAVAERQVEEAKAERGNGETILVAEDDDSVRSSVVTQLAELGYRVLAAANGQAALDILARGERIDLLFTDVVMPGPLNGRELAEQAHAIVPGLPVLYTSGYTENAIIHHGRLDEGVSLLSKPYRLNQLARAVRSALELSPGSVAPSPPLVGTTSTPPKILLVEDDMMINMSLTAFLTGSGYQVSATDIPSKALQELDADHQIKVLITDFTLPEMNGLALIREALTRKPELVIVLTSGHDINAAQFAGQPITVLNKPFHPPALLAAIQKSMALRNTGPAET